MKKINFKIWFCLFTLILCMETGAGHVYASGTSSATQSGSTASLQKNGWKKNAKGQKRYYKNGIYLTGLQKIGSSYYYFNKKGFLKTKDFTAGGYRYYTTLSGEVDGKRKNKTWYTITGKKLKGTAKEHYITKIRARKIVRQITDDTMSLSQKRLACFNWVRNHPYMHYRNFSRFSGWQATYANDHFLRKKGNCVSDACAFAFLAQALGYKNVYICLDGTTDSAHCWCEINGKVYDPLFSQMRAYGFSVSYNVSYSTYPDKGLRLRIRLK